MTGEARFNELVVKLLESIPEDHRTDDSLFTDVADGDDIETG